MEEAESDPDTQIYRVVCHKEASYPELTLETTGINGPFATERPSRVESIEGAITIVELLSSLHHSAKFCTAKVHKSTQHAVYIRCKAVLYGVQCNVI